MYVFLQYRIENIFLIAVYDREYMFITVMDRLDNICLLQCRIENLENIFRMTVWEREYMFTTI